VPEASSTSRTVEVLKKIMDILADIKGVDHYSAISGLNVVFRRLAKTNSGHSVCQLKPWDEPQKQIRTDFCFNSSDAVKICSDKGGKIL